MTYPSGANAEFNLLLRTIRGSLAFEGRSRRTEVLYYQIGIALLGAVFGFISTMVLPMSYAPAVIATLQLIVTLPMFALFVRRLHDQNKSGWWGLILPIGIGLNLTRHSDLTSQIDMTTASTILNLAYACMVILLLALLYWKGTSGPNRFGDDPRLS